MKIELSHPEARLTVQLTTNNEPDFIGIFGASGAGKTTLLRCLAGLEKSAIVYSNAVKANQRVGLVPHSPMLFPHLSVMQNIELAKTYEHRSKFAVKDVVTALHCDELVKRPVAILSAGEKQRVALVRAIVNAPDILLIDEALASFESSLRSAVLNYLKSLSADGMKIIMVSHHLPDLFCYSDFLIELGNGRVLWSGEQSEISNRPLNKKTAVDSIYSVLKRTNCVEEDTMLIDSKIVVNASNVVLEVAPASQSSLLHCFEGKITSIMTIEGEKVIVTIVKGKEVLHALISDKALKNLSLQEQQNIAARF